jgi:hypothetical protein
VGPRVGLEDVEKRKFLTLPGLELRPLGRPARSQSLYRLSYPGSLLHVYSLDTTVLYRRISRRNVTVKICISAGTVAVCSKEPVNMQSGQFPSNSIFPTNHHSTVAPHFSITAG